MNSIFALAILLFATHAWGQKSLKIYKQGEFIPIKIYQVDKVDVNQVCHKNKNCIALTVKKKPIKKRKGVLEGHPANDLCIAVGGRAHLLVDAKKNQINYCEFKDGSLIDSWHLYERLK